MASHPAAMLPPRLGDSHIAGSGSPPEKHAYLFTGGSLCTWCECSGLLSPDWCAAAFDELDLAGLVGGGHRKEVLMTEEKAKLPGPGETEGGRLDETRIPGEAQENPELRVPSSSEDVTNTEPSESNAPTRQSP